MALKLKILFTIVDILVMSNVLLVSCKSVEKKDDGPSFQSSMSPKLTCTSIESSQANLQFVLLADSIEPSNGAISVLKGTTSVSQSGVWLVSITQTSTAIVGSGHSAKGDVNLNVAIADNESSGEGIVTVPEIADHLKINCHK